ncbi:MAG: hypothetical protein RBT11_02285 [Desulfobacterales bacterium]|jgi:hypothetical protein|nr:hypothetical protein [Desulfobacterales bacterium]
MAGTVIPPSHKQITSIAEELAAGLALLFFLGIFKPGFAGCTPPDFTPLGSSIAFAHCNASK